MRILPINSTKQNNKKQNFTAIKADDATVLELRKVSSDFFDIYNINTVIANPFKNDYHGKTPGLGMYMTEDEIKSFRNIPNIHLNEDEAFDIRKKHLLDPEKFPIAKQLQELIDNAKVVTKEQAVSLVEANAKLIESIKTNLKSVF